MNESIATTTDVLVEKLLLAIVQQLAFETRSGLPCTITLHTSFERDLEFDSTARTELMLRIRKVFGIALPIAVLSQADTPCEVLRYLRHDPKYSTSTSAALLKFDRVIAGIVRAHAAIYARKIAAWAYGFYTWSIFALFILLFGGLAVLLQQPPYGRRIARCGARLLLRLARIPLSVTGLERLPGRPHILVVNHASFLDAIVLLALLPARPGYAFTTRQEFRSQILLYPLVRSVGTVILKHSDVKPHPSNVELMASVLRLGDRLVVFPEGAFSPEPGLKPFHSGAFAAAANANVPIVVAGLRGTRSALRSGTWLPRRVGITLEIGSVLAPIGNDQAAIMQLDAEAHKAMEPLSGECDPSAC